MRGKVIHAVSPPAVKGRQLYFGQSDFPPRASLKLAIPPLLYNVCGGTHCFFMFVCLLCQRKRSVGMTGWLRVGLKVNHHASPPKARGAADTMVISGGGQFCPQEGKMGVGRRGVACGSQPSYPSGMLKGMPVQ